MKQFNKISAVVLSCLMATSVAGCNKSTTTAASLKDGTYTASKHGHNGPVTLSVTLKDGKIVSIDTLESVETKGIGNLAIDKVVKAAVENNTANIDTSTGATISSGAAIGCIKDALKQAGADDAMLKAHEKVNINMVLDQDAYDFDVVVVGAGGAGLSAALTAVDNGASVCVVEKTSQCGGNTLVSGGGINIPCSDLQIAKGIDDSVELYTNDTLKGGDNIANVDLVETLAQNALPAYEWLKDEVKMDFIEERVQQFGGHSVARAVIPVGNSGYEMISKMEALAKDKGVEIFENTKAVAFEEHEGMIDGVTCENNGKEVKIHANKGVILASGGFGANVEMRKKYNPELDETYKTTCIAAASGDGIVMAENVGAALVDMEQIQVYPTCNPVTGIISYVANTRFDGGILVNKKGDRFVDEMNRRDVVANGILSQEDAVAYLLWDSAIEDHGHMTTIHENEYKALEKNNLVFKADTIEELAEKAGIDAEELKKTVDAYNTAIQEGVEPEIKKGGKHVAFMQAPFYLEKVAPATHHTMGGVVINPEAEVINVDGNIIDGLYAAGEVTGGIHGTNRLGGNAITDILVFGRIAGESCSK